ncbi:MAG: glycoside hydrolase family 3 N-terminal domain-containing protein [Candidatus Dormibacteraceae bacterium]
MRIHRRGTCARAPARLLSAAAAGAALLTGCSSLSVPTAADPGARQPRSPSPSWPSPSSPSPPPSPSAPPDPLATPGPGGLSLRQEVGAVMMVAFRGPATPQVLADWRAHQYGGLLVIPDNQNGATPGQVRAVIAAVRGTMAHPLIAATDQEGGTVCMRASGAPCLAGARAAGVLGPGAVSLAMRQMACGLRAAGFDEDLAPVAGVWDGVHPFMADRSYGQDPAAVSADVTAAVGAIHACGLLAAVKHFPGEATAAGDPHLELPTVAESAATLRARDWAAFRAAVRAGADMVMVGHMLTPALDPANPTSMSPAVMRALRSEIGFGGVAISDDLQMGALSSRFTVPDAALRFLEDGGDMVLIAHDLPVADQAYQAILEAVLGGSYPRSQLDASVSRVLASARRG